MRLGLNLAIHFEQEKKETTEEIEKLKTTADNLKDSTCKAEQLANEMVECAEKESEFRVEKDSIGTKDVPENVYYGVLHLCDRAY